MKKLDEFAFDYALSRKQFEEFRVWLAERDELSERDDVLPFFRARPHLAVHFGLLNSRIAWPDRIAWEFDIFGDFACDLVVGEWASGQYCFVEFEDARHDSIFKKQGAKATREWGRRFDHGYSQIIDWAHKLAGLSPGPDLLARFGHYEIHFEAVLVIGRDKHLDGGERQRLVWRRENVGIGAKKVICLTFDELLNFFAIRLSTLAAAVASTAASGRSATSAPTAEAPAQGEP